LKKRREIFRNAEQLRVTIREIWNQLANDREFFITLADSMKSRYQQVINKEGYYTGY
jgi:hypothetical protein